MNQCDSLTVVLAVVPAIMTLFGTLAGFGLNHFLETRRQETERENDLEDQARKTRRDILERLQYALADMHDGTEEATLRQSFERERGPEAAKAALNESWFRDWQNAARRVEVLAAQLDDQELERAAKEMGISYEQAQVIDRGDPKAFQDGLERLDAAFDRANGRAGHLIKELDAFKPARASRRK